RLNQITLLLRDNLDDSIGTIDKETGAFTLNTAAVRENIRLKRIQADEEASSLLLRTQRVIEQQEDLKKRLAVQQGDATSRGLMAGIAPGSFMSGNVQRVDA